jgi:hypothetical protein
MASFTYPDVHSALGTDQVQATVTNPAGTLRSSAVNVTWVAGTAGGGGGGPTAALSVLTGLSLRPAAFVAARSGPSSVAVASNRRFGTVVSYQASQSAIMSFTVFRPVSGQRRGKACVSVARRHRAGKPCVRLVAAGYFTRDDGTGASRFRFTGRVQGHTLAPGRYLLQVVPHNAGGAGPARSRTFRVLRR